MAFDMAGIATEPLMMRSAGVVKNRFSLAGQVPIGWRSQRDRTNQSAGCDVDDLHGIVQVIGNSHPFRITKESNCQGPSTQREPPKLAVAGCQPGVQGIPRIASAPRNATIVE